MPLEQNCHIPVSLATATSMARSLAPSEALKKRSKGFPANVAVLDSQLSDRDLTPIALHLCGADVPFVIRNDPRVVHPLEHTLVAQLGETSGEASDRAENGWAATARASGVDQKLFRPQTPFTRIKTGDGRSAPPERR